jgi:hypothetical protein
MAIESGTSGLVTKASPSPVGNETSRSEQATAPREEDDYVDVVAEGNFLQEITEILLAVDPELRSSQVKTIRLAFAGVAKKYGWLVSCCGDGFA